MKLKLILLAISSTLPAASFAQAKSFEGWGVSFGVGYGQVTPATSNGTVSAGGNSVGSFATTSTTLGTPTASLGLEYNKAISPSWLLGAGVTYLPGNSATASNNTNATVLGNTASSSARYWLSNLFTAYIKTGVALNETELVYVKGGYTSATNNTDTFSIPLAGWLAGLGYQRNFGSRWYGFSEMIYSAVGPTSLPNNLFTAVNPALSNNGSASATAIEVKIGLGYLF